jgi:hypothetical protein
MTSTAGPGRPRRWAAGLAWALWALAILGLLVTAWLDHLLRQAGRPDLAQETALDGTTVLVVLSATTVGAVLGNRRPNHPVGWLLLALGLSMAAAIVAQAYADYGFRARPGALPAARYVALYGPAILGAWLGCIGFILLLTPTGSLPSPRWRWWARVMVAAPVVSLVATLLLPNSLNSDYQTLDNPLALRAFGGALRAALWVALAISVLAVLVAAGSLVVRFRRAHGVERQQLRWVALAAAVVAPAALVLVAAAAATTLLAAASTTTLWRVFNWALVVCVTILPLAIGAAILRYRLYDLDRIVSRTGDAGGRRRVSAGPPSHPAGGRPALQPAQVRRRPDHRGVQCAPARPDRPGHPLQRAAGGRRPDHGADPGLAVASTLPTRLLGHTPQ